MRGRRVNIEIQVPGIVGQAVGDTLGPFDREAPGGCKEVVDHQGVQIGARAEAIGVEMHELATALIERIQIEGRAGDWLDDLPCAREPTDKGGLACAEVAVKGKDLVLGHERREGARDPFGFVGGFGDDTLAELLEEIGPGCAHEDFKCSNPCVHGKAVFVWASMKGPFGEAS